MKRTVAKRITAFLLTAAIIILAGPSDVFAGSPITVAGTSTVSTELKTAPVRVIAHGGGSFHGYETSNSVEAVNQSIARGCSLIELDMELTLDGRIVMIHDWDRTTMNYYGKTFSQKLTKKQFDKLSVYGQLEVLDMDKLAEILKKNTAVRIITDTKGDNLELLRTLKMGYPDLTDRFIPQIYTYDQLESIRDLGFENIILTLYAMADPDMTQVAAFAREHGIYAVTTPDYMADKGYCRMLAAKGIVVYVHPVSDYETALDYIKQGAYGVYSGTLLPEEFDGMEKDCHLAETAADGSLIKLTDARFDNWQEVKLLGLKPGETVLYYIDQSLRCAEETDFADLKPGKHELEISIRKGNEAEGTLDYFLMKDGGGLRIVHWKYEYRLDAVRQQADFDTVIRDAGISEEAREILEHSLIAKEGEASYYHNGAPETFMNGDELIAARAGSYRKLLLPLSETLKELGADSVTMSGEKDIVIQYNGETIRIMAGTCIVRRGFMITRLSNPVILYLNRSMAGGEFYQNITSRRYIEDNGMIIILPEGARTDKETARRLLDAAARLFKS
jgi:glycerophosphoryl diester phosphodiesterase